MIAAIARKLLHVAVLAAIACAPVRAQEGLLSADELESRVVDLFARSCARAGCHAGPIPQMGMDLTPERFYATTVGQPSTEAAPLKRVYPGRPDSSYLVMKVKGAPGIVGMQMPLAGDRLTPEEVSLIEEWIKRATIDPARNAAEANRGPRSSSEPFPFFGWKVANLPTNRTVDGGSFLFLIGHRFNPKLGDGYDAFYGLDGSGIIFLNLGYAISDQLFVNLGRSNADDNVELSGKYVATQQRAGGSPLAVGVQATINWESEKVEGEDRLRGEVLKAAGQLVLTRAFGDRVGLAAVPGILANPSSSVRGENPLVTLGLGGRVRFARRLSVVVEWVPIVSGYTRTRTFGNDNRFDSWAGGLEIATAGHVFQIVVGNSVGITTDQYMRGGDLDFTEGEARLGFNIFRVLQF